MKQNWKESLESDYRSALIRNDIECYRSIKIYEKIMYIFGGLMLCVLIYFLYYLGSLVYLN